MTPRTIGSIGFSVGRAETPSWREDPGRQEVKGGISHSARRSGGVPTSGRSTARSHSAAAGAGSYRAQRSRSNLLPVRTAAGSPLQPETGRYGTGPRLFELRRSDTAGAVVICRRLVPSSLELW